METAPIWHLPSTGKAWHSEIPASVRDSKGSKMQTMRGLTPFKTQPQTPAGRRVIPHIEAVRISTAGVA